MRNTLLLLALALAVCIAKATGLILTGVSWGWVVAGLLLTGLTFLGLGAFRVLFSMGPK